VIRCQITDGSARLHTDVDFIQIRVLEATARELVRIVRLAMTAGPRVLVNDRLDVALACGAAGVHLRGGSIDPLLARPIAPAGFIISVACHDEADVARATGADLVVLAPIFHPLSKAGSRRPLGLDYLRRISLGTSIPVIALGGITESNAAACVEAGASGVAGISLFRG
jgi:thiamine-phosphate pyrophosphorylase